MTKLERRMCEALLQDAATEIARDWDIPEPDVTLTKRLAGWCAGRVYFYPGELTSWPELSKTERMRCTRPKIALNLRYLDHFGFERVYRTLLHELAHLIDVAYNGMPADDHGPSFMEICAELGGSMPKGDTPEEYANIACDEYLPPRYAYICSKCGAVYERNRRWSEDQINRFRCADCHEPMRTAKLEQRY